MSKKLFFIFIGTLVCKLILLPFIPLVLDEYYYWVWGQFPQWSYFDHPPFVGWLMILGDWFQPLFAQAIRIPFVLVSQLTILIWYLIFKDHLSERKLGLLILILSFNPLSGWGGVIATPDIPLLFFWSSAVYFANKIELSNSWRNYAGLGASLGLGFSSKYVMVLIVPCLIIFVFQRKLLHRVFHKRFLFTLLFGLITCLPVLYWNGVNNWDSFLFQWKHGMSAEQWKARWPFDYLLGQILILFPVFIWAFLRNTKTFLRNPFSSFAIFPLLFFLYSSFKGRVEANWPIVAYPSFYAIALSLASPTLFSWMRKTVYFWSSCLILVIAITQLSHHEKVRKLRIFESEKYRPALEFAMSHPNTFVENYQMASFISFELKRPVCKLPHFGRRDFFEYLPHCQKTPDHFFYIVINYANPDFATQYPDYQVVGSQPLNNDYKILEVRKI